MQHYKTTLTLMKVFTAAAVLMTAVAQAALTGDVIVNGWTTTTASGMDFSFAHNQATAVGVSGDFGNFQPPLDNVPLSVTVSDFTLKNVNPTTWMLEPQIQIDFGNVAFNNSAQKFDLSFFVDPGQLFTGHATGVNNYSFMELQDLSGHWEYNGATVGLAHLNLTRLTLNPKSKIPGEFQFAITSVPEPATYLAGLGTLGMLGLFGWRSRK